MTIVSVSSISTALAVLLFGSAGSELIGLIPPFTPPVIAVAALASGIAGMANVWWRANNRGLECLFVTTGTNVLATAAVAVGALRNDMSWVAGSFVLGFALPAAYFVIVNILPKLRGLLAARSRLNATISALLVSGAVGIVSTAGRSVSDLIARASLVSAEGVSANGLAQPYYIYTSVLVPQVISIMIALIITAHVTGLKDPEREILKGVVALLAFAALVSLFADQLIGLAFSSDFVDGTPLLVAGSWADVSKWLVVILLAYQLALGKNTAVLFVSVASLAMRTGLVYVLIPALGMIGIAIATAIESAGCAIFLIVMTKLRRRTKLALGIAVVASLLVVLIGAWSYGN
ncbi:hypothetical protein LG299_14180 [Microbacterium lacus]|uniref:hypothetical protein n=1 Tax=Microbacterium lacus TaxID=415217 RepID=UPI00384BCCBC